MLDRPRCRPPRLSWSRDVFCRAAVVLVATLLAPTGGAAEPRPEPTTDMPPIVARSIDFHGGEAVLGSRVALTLRSASGASRIEARSDGALFDYVVTSTGGDGVERRVRFANAEGENRVEMWLDGEVQELDGEGAGRAERWLMARVYFPFLPFRLADPGVYFQDFGTETWPGLGELHKVKVTFEPGSSPDADDEFLYWFDPETGRLEQFAYSFHTGNGGLRLRRAVDFHRVGGILFSDQENLGVNFTEGGPRPPVDAITPAFAADMEPVSTVHLEDVEVEPVSASGPAGEDGPADEPAEPPAEAATEAATDAAIDAATDAATDGGAGR